MKLFECQHCGQPLYFENTLCESCGHRLGYLAGKETVTALEPDGEAWQALAEPQGRYRYCRNAEHGACNWLVRSDEPQAFCIACQHNRTIPDLNDAENVARWRRIEGAKHRLIYTLLKLGLPLVTKQEDPNGLAFDFLADPSTFAPSAAPVMTGHENGLITINLAEADDAERERARSQMGEPYRTLLGHFRHEIAHYYWDRLVAGSSALEDFRRVFGDERQDYGARLRAHHGQGPPPRWQEWFVSSYASAHPWEDFAETWAHYLHMVDTLETADAFGLRVNPKVGRDPALAMAIDFDPYRQGDFDALVQAWLPLTYAVNSLNQSMGQPDLYPFVLAPTVMGKLRFVHGLIHRSGM